LHPLPTIRTSSYSNSNAVRKRLGVQGFHRDGEEGAYMIHAGTCGAVMHDVKAVEAADTLDGPAVAAKMRELPVNDRFTRASGGLVFGPRAASSSRATPPRSASLEPARLLDDVGVFDDIVTP
jgi:hypothetical protein